MAAGASRAVGRASRRLADGIPVGFVAALATLVLVAVLYTVATREPREPRGYGEFTVFPEGCVIERARQLNVRSCVVLGRGAYLIRFTKSLDGSTAIATRGSCCPGEIAASVQGEHDVVLSMGRRVTQPVRASVLVP